ncbi:MAG: UvrD-helicase domain-containing protein [Flavobacterium sp.]|nr:UvrD-helicase domain-containing protein [Flavobacterium sp.]
MIKGFDENNIGNPIRKHVNISFEKVYDREEMLKKIVEDLSANFNETKSTVLIFVPTRKGTEEASRALNNLFEENNLNNLHNKIDFFHAGLDSSDREEKYINFKQGKLLILVATKAFGMGMDIKNIHFVYHLGPSSTFEDYLQEVGRAGRNATMLKEAGFSDENQIKTKCLYTPQDFNYLRDKLHKNQITWTHLIQVKEAVFEYVKKFKPIIENDENSFPLPLDLLDYVPEFKDRYNRDTFFRVCLYWLEKLNRLSLGVFTPTHLPISILEQGHTFRSVTNEIEKNNLIKLHQNLIEYKKNNFPEADSVMISISELKELTATTNTSEMFKVVFSAQRCKLIVVEREILLEPTKLKMAELNNGIKTNNYPIINAAFSFSETILEETILGSQKRFEPEELENLVKPIVYETFKPTNFNWKEQKGSNGNDNYTSQELTEKAKNDFIKKRAKFAFKLLSFIPKIKHKSIIVFEKGYEKPITTQLIFNGSKSNEKQNNYINVFKKDLIKLTNIIAKNYITKQKSSFNIIDLINDLGIDNKGDEYFQNLIFIAKGLGYLKGEGSLIPMGIELYIKETESFQDEIKETNDYIVKEEFLDTGKMKQLRLLALECLSERPYHEQDKFIKNFFKCGTIKELLELLEIHFSENNPVLAAFREEALKEEVKLLNPQQLKVFETKLNKNIQVIAGPGSGKTHTLILRIARLIQEEKINPENILVLAYNRAVVVELKERLTKLFKSLGYSKLISSLKVFTFHGFAKYCLGQQLKDLDFESWTPEFIKIMNDSPGLINQKLGLIKYVFVDEFQDITNERLDLLKFIASPKETKICVIGDPNQSIYGYQRVQKGEPMEPKPYYEKFKEIYNPVELNLNINYRSYPLILEEAENLLALNDTKYEMPKLEAFLQPTIKEDYCNIVGLAETRIDWKQKVKEFVDFRDENNEKYKQIAVMFRSNDEVYRAFNILKNEKIKDVKIRIQGTKGSLYQTREFYHIIFQFQEKSENLLEKKYISDFIDLKNKMIKKYPNWEEYYLDIFHCILLEFDKEREDESTYQDLIDLIKEISKKDDGQFGKIYSQNIGLIKSDYIYQEIIVTTMHKVKGIEYDAVIIPASLSDLPTTKVAVHIIKDYIEEERRLYYVAYTRAKKQLFVIQNEREKALKNGEPYLFEEEKIKDKFGLKIIEGIDKFTMYWSASNFGLNSFEYIRNNVKIGDSIFLNKKPEGALTFWYVIHNKQKIAQLSLTMVGKLIGLKNLSGFVVSTVYVNTYEETKQSDDKNGTSYSNNWTQTAKERGYIYLIDFSGYGKI